MCCFAALSLASRGGAWLAPLPRDDRDTGKLSEVRHQERKADMQNDWTKPAAVAIPEGGFFKDKVEQGRYGPIFPKTPACYGFSILAKLIPGREERFYEYARNIEQAVAGQPDCLAILKLH